MVHTTKQPEFILRNWDLIYTLSSGEETKLFYLEKKGFVIEMIEDCVNKNPVMLLLCL